jgi:hypothetical protein
MLALHYFQKIRLTACTNRNTRNDEGVKVLIDGGASEGYRVPKSSLCRISSVLKTMINNQWSVEGCTSVINAPKDETVVWTIFLYWLHVPEAELYKELTYSSGTYGIKCVVFADKYDIPAFHDMAMTILYTSKCVFPIRLVKQAYATNPNNPVRKFIIQRIAHTQDFNISRVSKWKDLDGTSFLLDILKEIAIEHKEPNRGQQRINHDILRHSLHGRKKHSTECIPNYMGLTPEAERWARTWYRKRVIKKAAAFASPATGP